MINKKLEETVIQFFNEFDFELENQERFKTWIHSIIDSEEKIPGEINYIFCDDHYLHDINVKYLDHDTLTDIISFDNTTGNLINGEIYISIERVNENAREFNVTFENELKRVMAHGILHFCGYKDKTSTEKELMRIKEEEKIALF